MGDRPRLQRRGAGSTDKPTQNYILAPAPHLGPGTMAPVRVGSTEAPVAVPEHLAGWKSDLSMIGALALFFFVVLAIAVGTALEPMDATDWQSMKVGFRAAIRPLHN